MARIGETVDILSKDFASNQFGSEGRALVVGRTPWEHYYWVRFEGTDIAVVRFVDPVGALLGSGCAERFNSLIAATGADMPALAAAQ